MHINQECYMFFALMQVCTLKKVELTLHREDSTKVTHILKLNKSFHMDFKMLCLYLKIIFHSRLNHF